MVGLMVLVSCKQELSLSHEYLEGRWEVVQGFRGEIPTRTLTGASFVFDHSLVTTNFTGSEVISAVQIDPSKKMFKLVSIDQFFLTTIKSDRELELRAAIKGTAFRLILIKK